MLFLPWHTKKTSPTLSKTKQTLYCSYQIYCPLSDIIKVDPVLLLSTTPHADSCDLSVWLTRICEVGRLLSFLRRCVNAGHLTLVLNITFRMSCWPCFALSALLQVLHTLKIVGFLFSTLNRIFSWEYQKWWVFVIVVTSITPIGDLASTVAIGRVDFLSHMV